MKKLVSLLLVMAMLLTLTGCDLLKFLPGFGEKTPETVEPALPVETAAPPMEEPAVEATEPEIVTGTDYVNVDGIYMDTSYVDDDGPLKMVYLFLTINATDKNMDVDCKYTRMIIGQNTYESDFYKGACKLMPSYYYSSFIEEVYIGEQIRIVLTFKVPQGELNNVRDITFSDTSMPVNDLALSTGDIVVCGSPEEIAAQADPEGYAAEQYLRSPADAAATAKVQNLINGYYFSFYVSAGTSLMPYELEFYAPNSFEVRTNIGSNTGTYQVMNGYIYCTYPTNNYTVEIPYEIDATGEIVLYCAEAFSIYE